MRRRAREKQKRENRPISKRLRATLLRSFRGLHGEKMVCVRTGTLGKAKSHFNPTQTSWGPHHHVEAAIDWCSSISRFTCIYYIYDRKFSLHYPKRSESTRVLGTDRKFVTMSRVKVNSISELVGNREEKSALFGVICCCCDDRLLSRAVISGNTV